jgi:signal transduction histidine kinase/GAF domain-containing protein
MGAMSLTEQIILLLSESPGNVVYHLVTLFALQVVFALGLTQWRRDSLDMAARRLTWAAGGMVLLRLALLMAGLLVYGDSATAVSLLPPLEQAIHTATAVLLVWALLPGLGKQNNIGDTATLLLLLLVGMLYIFFAQAWPEQALDGVAYHSTTQALVWNVAQLAILLTGLALTVTERPLWFSLNQIILLILLATHLLHFFANPDLAPNQTDIAYWVRFGYLIALPLWAVLTYRRGLASLIQQPGSAHRPETQLPALLDLSGRVIRTLQPEQNVRAALQMAETLLPTPYVALGLSLADTPERLSLISNQATDQEKRPSAWSIHLNEWPAFQQALQENESIELKPTGLGARQLRLWYEEAGLPSGGALLILPLAVEARRLGLLLLGRKSGDQAWPEGQMKIAAALAQYTAQALHNSLAFAQVADQIANKPQPTRPDEGQTSGRIIALEEERDRLKSDLDVTATRLLHAETQAAKSTRQARDLAATLEELEKISQDDRLTALEAEIETLRESLFEAEEAMALAAAGEGGLSTAWIMTTITRYSSQLETAQARIQTLEAELMRRERGITDELVVSVAQELRTPMTSIAGYTDLLLSEMTGKLGVKQRDFLQRVKANVERMDAFLDLIVQLTAGGEKTLATEVDLVDVQVVVETAVSTVITQIREKRLRLDLNLPEKLPHLAINREALQQIINNLVSNACQASRTNGQIGVRAYVNNLPSPSDNGHVQSFHFIHLAVADSGSGIPVADRARVFDPQHRADNPLIDGLGDTGAGLAIARTLTEAHGGRVWIESEEGVGSTFSILFPITAEAVY